ncbi:MAG: rubrerythrin family protein [Peptostreptococcaceae bacterium]|nr:rubrerythrin family protein [Peptostreptococcaceae bacterium]
MTINENGHCEGVSDILQKGKPNDELACPICEEPTLVYKDPINKIEGSNKYAGTKTAKNLLEAFAEGSKARNKYAYFAEVAEKEGYEQIADVFLQTAKNEKEQARLCLGELGGIRNTAHNLITAAEIEMYEANDTYGRCAKEADAEGFPEMAESFRKIAEIDKAYGDSFRKLIAEMEIKKKPKKAGDSMWKCRICGHLIIGKAVPEICPVCNYSKSYFEVKEDKYKC